MELDEVLLLLREPVGFARPVCICTLPRLANEEPLRLLHLEGGAEAAELHRGRLTAYRRRRAGELRRTEERRSSALRDERKKRQHFAPSENQGEHARNKYESFWGPHVYHGRWYMQNSTAETLPR